MFPSRVKRCIAFGTHGCFTLLTAVSCVCRCCRYVNTLLKLVPQVLALQDQLREAIQNGDMETCHGICRITVSLGENHSRCVCGQ